MELKFRAWNKNFEEYAEVAKIDFLNNDVWIIDPDLNSPEQMDMSEVILEQYTGMKDKNGKEIYVGDVFKIKHGYNWKKESYFEVVFSRSFGYILRNENGDWFPLKDKAKEYEVIGNIHEREED